MSEPFGYFKAEPFGWTDCAETDEGAVALYERRPWVGLTDEEQEIASWADGSFGAGARWAEVKLREKNQ